MSGRYEDDIDIDEPQQPCQPKCCIYRVHEGLHKVKPEAYEPLVVSIGPYHCRNPRLDAMNKHKLGYCESLLGGKRARLWIINWDPHIESEGERFLQQFGERLIECYAEPVDIWIEIDHTMYMMVADCCFIIEFFRKKTRKPFLSIEWMQKQICSDLMLLGNQVPFFLLSHFYDMTKEDAEESLIKIALSVFTQNITQPACLNIEVANKLDPQGIEHLLHLVHISCIPLSESTITGYSSIQTRILKRSESITDDSSIRMRSVVELQEAGVKFKKVGELNTNNANLFDVKFDKGLMKVPCFAIGKSTDVFFRNLIAYEQLSSGGSAPKYFTDFALFMHQLIKSERDVELLRHERIIVNFLDNDKEVVDLFNQLTDGITFSSTTFYYSGVCRSLNTHCAKTWNKMMAKIRRNNYELRRDYCKNSWTTIATIAAAILLLLTLLQTISSIIPLFKETPLV